VLVVIILKLVVGFNADDVAEAINKLVSGEVMELAAASRLRSTCGQTRFVSVS
jgi:hypothetical protein